MCDPGDWMPGLNRIEKVFPDKLSATPFSTNYMLMRMQRAVDGTKKGGKRQ